MRAIVRSSVGRLLLLTALLQVILGRYDHDGGALEISKSLHALFLFVKRDIWLKKWEHI